MKINLNTEYLKTDEEILQKHQGRALEIIDELWLDKEAYTGWVHYASKLSDDFITEIEKTADEVSKLCDTLVVIGIGGSYLGSAAILEALGGARKGRPDLFFAGTNLSGNAQSRILERLSDEDRDFAICVVSKSGTTMESMIGFSLFKDALIRKYGEKASSRIIAITDPAKGLLREEAKREGYRSFEIPSNIGGRYSAYTPAIIFPLAVAGVDIRSFIEGARSISDLDYWKNEGFRYALSRFAMLETGKALEVYEYFDPSLRLFGEWMKQLFAESEGKDGKGLFPVTLTLSTDLHSIGQYLQEGKPMFFETFFDVKEWSSDVTIPESIGNNLGGMSLNAVNKTALEGVVAAHSKAGTPILKLEIAKIDEYTLGQLTYYCMMTAAITGKLMGVDPFNQPGVEQYKKEIRERLDI